MDVAIRGLVQDVSGAALPGVTVTATSTTTNLVRIATTDNGGYYRLLPIPAGTYDVRVELAGFSTQVRREQTFHVATTITLDFQLDLARVTETIVVRDEAPILETANNTLSRLVQKHEIDALPVVSRNFNDLAGLSPGVTRTGIRGGVDISGSRDFHNAYNVDGVSSETHAVGTQRVAYSQDWIEEFQVLTTQYAAEFGQASGGVLNAITRSGSNQLSGRVYAFHRNDTWDAKPEFADRKPPLEEYRAGATLGGPIIRDKFFFFTGFEWLDSESNNIVTSAFPEANGTFPFNRIDQLVLGKLEYHPRPSSTIRLRYNRQDLKITGAAIGGISSEEHGRFFTVPAFDTVATWTQIVSPTLFNEARAAFSSFDVDGGCNFAERNPPGTWFERAYPGGRFGCPVNFGQLIEEQHQWIDNLSWAVGSHDMKVGVQALRTRAGQDFRNFRDGVYVFDKDVRFSLEDPASYPFAFFIIEGPTVADISSWSYGLFVQDSWRVSENLTLNLGVRYDRDESFRALNPFVRVDQGLELLEVDTDNVAPRLGIAWTPLANDRRTVIRGGVGLYYDQNHNNLAGILLSNNILVDRVILIVANSPVLNPFWPDVERARRLLAEALARNTIPDVSSIPGIVGSTNNLDPQLQVPVTRQASMGVAHEFAGGVDVSVDVVYARGRHQLTFREDNIDRDAWLQERRIVLRNPNFTSIGLATNGGEFDYRAVQVQANYRPNGRHLLKLAYTWAENETNTVLQWLSGGGTTNPFDLEEDKGPADNDVRHTVSLNGSTSLPWGIEVSGIAYYRSALPYSVTTTEQLDDDPWQDRPEPRNSRRGDDFFSLDARLSKTFSLGDRRSMTVFVEGFNLTNQTNFSRFIGNIDSELFGQPTTADPKRRAQVGVRFEF